MTRILVIHRDPAGLEPFEEAIRSLGDLEVEVVGPEAPPPSPEALEAGGVDLVLLRVGRARDVDRAWLEGIRDRGRDVEVLIALDAATEREIVELVRLGAAYLHERARGRSALLGSIRRILRLRALTDDLRGERRGAMELSCAVRDWLEVTAPSEPRFLERFHHVARLLCETRFTNRQLQSLLYAISEIGLNAIEWGNRKDPRKRIRLSFCLLEDRVLLKVEDEGEGFDPDRLADPTADPAAHLARRKAQGKRIGGFGIWMVKGLMDEVLYSDRGNTVVMVKYLDAERELAGEGAKG